MCLQGSCREGPCWGLTLLVVLRWGQACGLLGCESPFPHETVGDCRAWTPQLNPICHRDPLFLLSDLSLVFSPARVEGKSTDPYTTFL